MKHASNYFTNEDVAEAISNWIFKPAPEEFNINSKIILCLLNALCF